MAIRPILALGDENLHQKSIDVSKENIIKAEEVINDLHDTLMNFRRKYGFGRAITAPQISEFYRIIYINIDGESIPIINPKIEFIGDEKIELWDDCMSFPGLEVRLYRYKKCRVHYKNLNWDECVLDMEGDLSELVQHEYDHLDGILAVQRAIDGKSFRINKKKSGYF